MSRPWTRYCKHVRAQYTRASIHIHAEQGQAGSGISHCGMVRAVQDDLASCKSSSPMCTILATPQAYMYYPIYQLPQLPSSSPTCAIFTTNYPAALYVLSSLPSSPVCTKFIFTTNYPKYPAALYVLQYPNYPTALYVLSSLHLVEDVAKSQKGVAFLPKLNCLITKLTKLN